MLRRGVGIAVLVALGLGFLVSSPAAAEGTCVAWEKAANLQTGGFTIVCAMYDYSGGGSSGPGDDDSSGGGTQECVRTDYGGPHKLDCVTSAGTWNNARECYVRVADPQPGKSDPVWEGNTDGYVLACDYPDVTGYDRGVSYFWAASSPDDLLPSPREIADRLILTMDMSSGRVGSTPPSTTIKGDSMGLIGVPMWFWVEDPDGTMNPQPESQDAGPFTVTATPRLDRVVWTLTDRHSGAVQRTVTCAGSNARGTQWSTSAGGDGLRPSPTCGLAGSQNDVPGEYSLSAQAYWVVDWQGDGETGSVPVTPPASPAVPIDIAELQSIVVS